jgi:glycosyltransferase involved in cell wall biosynthesis
VPDGPYVLYPANFWPHKNHRTLFEALRRHRARRPGSRLRLVCTGAPGPAMRALQAAAEPEQVIFAGYVAPAQLEALFRSCLGVVVPSLYEGFGMPVLEGMAHEKPVLCSNVTSLPEVAGDAAVYFDPLDAEQIASALGRLEDEPVAMAELAARGRARAACFGTARDLAARYLDVFDAVLAERVA